ncbi:hypothetical protein GOBAR_DD18803 [Gossypium barbadense]|nr:hypothetical protein GOBAR_DD18803 [Gossypium barbadense]
MTGEKKRSMGSASSGADQSRGINFENIRPPVMEGLDTLIMRKKQSSKSSSLESNGSSSNQTSPASQWFSSKSSKKSGTDERSVPGNTIAVQADMPFSGLTTFGTAFLSKFECSQMPHPVS